MLPSLFGKRSSKRGNAALVGGAASTVFGLFMIGILVFAFAIAGGEMKTATNDSTAQSIIDDTLSGATSFAGFSPVLWIITAVSLLISILLVGVGGYFMAGALRR